MKISILSAVYNEEEYIIQCIKSVSAQRNVNLEHIIVDDFSTDKTSEIVKLYSSLDSRIIYMHNDIKGKVNAFNMAFRKSSGDILVFLGGDDFITPDSLLYRHNLFNNIKFLEEPTVFHHALITASFNPKSSGLRIPRSSKKGNKSGQTTTFNRLAAELIFPIPNNLPSEDCWANIVSEYLCNSFNDSRIVVNYRIHSKNTVPRGKSFDKFNQYLSAREEALNVFVNKYPSLKKKLDSKIRLNQFRKEGRIKHLFFLKGVSIQAKIRAIFYSNAVMYKIRNKFFQFFSGW